MATYAKGCLEGKTILITGGMGAIGKAVAGQLLAQSARVVVNDLIPESEAHSQIVQAGWPHDRCLYVQADVVKSADVQSLTERMLQVFEQLYVLLCHTRMVYSGPILICSEGEWNRVMAINLKGAFLVAQAAAHAMIHQGITGKIVFTSSWVRMCLGRESHRTTFLKAG